MLMARADTVYQVKVISSAVRSDHKAILAIFGTPHRDRAKSPTGRTSRRRTPGQNATILQVLASFNDEGDHLDMGAAWTQFYLTTTPWLDQYYPERRVSIYSREL